MLGSRLSMNQGLTSAVLMLKASGTIAQGYNERGADFAGPYVQSTVSP